jgi:hypothetical protein
MPEVVLERAEQAAHEFATTLNAGAHHACKLRARKESLDAIQAGIDNMRDEFKP